MRFCAQNRSELGCCDAAAQTFPDQRCPASPVCEEAGPGQIPELSEMLQGNRTGKLRTWGTCMFPSIRPGDSLRIEPAAPDAIRSEDIVIFRHGLDLLAHRVIGVDRREDGTGILTRADNAPHKQPIRVRPQDILGRVTGIERNNRVLAPPPRKQRPPLLRALVRAYIRLYGCATLAERTLLRFWALQCRGMRFRVAVPVSASADCRFFRRIGTESFIREWQDEHSRLPLWSVLCLLGKKTLGSLTLVRRPDSCPYPGWWMLAPRMHPALRHPAAERRLISAAHRICRLLRIAPRPSASRTA